MPHTVREDNSKEEHGSSLSSHCQRNGARERAQSRSPRRGYDLRRRFVEYGDCHHSVSRRSRRRRSRASPPRQDQPSASTLPRGTERSRSPLRGYDLRRRFVKYEDYHHSVSRRSRRRRSRASPPHQDQPFTSTLPRGRQRSRSPQRGYDPHSRSVEITEYDPSARRRRRSRRRGRVSVPQRRR